LGFLAVAASAVEGVMLKHATTSSANLLEHEVMKK